MVLAAGKGERLRPLTDALPKTLLAVNGERTILDVVLANFAAVGLERAVIVTGFAAGRVDDLLPELERRHGLALETVVNPKAEEWNNAYSLWCARSHFAEGVLLSNGDTVHPPSVEEDVLGARGTADLVIAVDGHKPLAQEEMKVHLAADGRLERINKALDPVAAQGEYIGITLIEPSAADALAGALEATWGATRGSTTRTASRSSRTAAATWARRRSGRSSGSRWTTTLTSPGRGTSRAAPDADDRRAPRRGDRRGDGGAAGAAAGRPAHLQRRPRRGGGRAGAGRRAGGGAAPQAVERRVQDGRRRLGERGDRARARVAHRLLRRDRGHRRRPHAGHGQARGQPERAADGLGGHEPRPRRARLAGGVAGRGRPQGLLRRADADGRRRGPRLRAPGRPRAAALRHRRRAEQPVGHRGLAAGRARPRRGGGRAGCHVRPHGGDGRAAPRRRDRRRRVPGRAGRGARALRAGHGHGGLEPPVQRRRARDRARHRPLLPRHREPRRAGRGGHAVHLLPARRGGARAPAGPRAVPP